MSSEDTVQPGDHLGDRPPTPVIDRAPRRPVDRVGRLRGERRLAGCTPSGFGDPTASTPQIGADEQPLQSPEPEVQLSIVDERSEA